MPLDAITLSALKNELSSSCVGTRIEKIHQPDRDILIFSLRDFAFSGKLLVCGGNGTARVHFTDEHFDNPPSPPMFCMLMRKHLEGARIDAVIQPERERILIFKLTASTVLGDETEKRLIVELIGGAANVILTDGDGVIIECLRRTGSASESVRAVLPGLKYRFPASQGKTDIEALSDDELMSVISSFSPDKQADKALLDAFSGFSPLICRELVNSAYGITDIRMYYALKTDGAAALKRELCALRDRLQTGFFVPTMLSEPSGRSRDYSCIPINQYGNVLVSSKKESFSKLLDEYYSLRTKLERTKARSAAIIKLVKTAAERTRRKLELQRRELADAENREILRQNGDILMANLLLIPKGASEFEADDFYGESGTKRIIRLDRAKSAQQNAAKYYKDYQKAKNASGILSSQIEAGEKELEYLESVLDECERCETDKDVSEIRSELENSGYIRQQKKDKFKRAAPSKPMHFVSSTGRDIFVGRNNVQNDQLTLKGSMNYDLWLHTQKIHGSHTVVRTNGEKCDEVTLLEAASLAAYYSKARLSGKVAVDYTIVKNVKKPSGAKPGMVIYTDYKTVFAAPSAELAEKLMIKG